MIKPRYVEAKKLVEHDVNQGIEIYIEHTNMFNSRHLVKDLPVDKDSYLVWEIQGTPLTKEIYYDPEDFDIYSG